MSSYRSCFFPVHVFLHQNEITVSHGARGYVSNMVDHDMKPTAILCSDLHLRETQPEARLDDFMETQARKLAWLKNLQIKYDCPILSGGDTFHHWRPSPYLLAWCLRNLPDNIITTPGQHDLPAHNLSHITKSGLQVLSDAGKVVVLTDTYLEVFGQLGISGFPWGVELNGISPLLNHSIAIIHYGVYQSKPHYPGAEEVGGTARSVIKKMPGFDLIVSGDNHLTFTRKIGNQLLVNPGSFTRQSAAQMDHKPCVFLWCAKTNEVEQVFVPIEEGVINRNHIDVENEKNERLTAFVERMNTDIEVELSFEKNLE